MENGTGEQNSGFYRPDDAGGPDSSTPALPASDETVSWTASEFIAHHKGAGWYAGLGVAGGLACVLAYLLTQGDKISTAVIALAVVALGVFAARQPRVLDYAVNNQGIQIGTRFYPYGLFKSFSIIEEGGIDSIYLMPLKRFMPAISVYFDPEDGEKIVNVLASHLPHDDRQNDLVDRMMRKIRF